MLGMMVAAELKGPAVAYLIPSATLVAAWPELELSSVEESPFRPPAALTEADAGRLLGRAEETTEVVARVRKEPVITLVGPSGPGKSSPAMAGVLPRLRELGYASAVMRPASGAVTRRPAGRFELTPPEWEVAQRLAATRILVADSGEHVELAHEALITAWPRLAGWVAEDHEFLAWRESLRIDLARWREAGGPAGLLRQGGVIEVWDTRPVRRPIGPLPSADVPFTARFLDASGRYLVASDNKIRVYRTDGQGYGLAYDPGPTDDLDTDTPVPLPRLLPRRPHPAVLRDPGPDRPHLETDPEVWADALCGVLGGVGLTSAERDTQPVPVPASPVCP